MTVMNLHTVSIALASVETAAANHLWQSTGFAAFAGLLTLALRGNQARTRYWLWLAASLKFLVPFSLLAVLGSHLAPARREPPAQRAVYVALDVVSQPFETDMGPVHARVTARSTPMSGAEIARLLLAGVWLCGMGFFATRWFWRWRVLKKIVREAEQALAGREFEMLGRVAGMERPVRLMVSGSAMGPGVWGLVRPVLIWPKALTDRLSDEQMEAILAHELTHVRRRDNLAAATQMVVEMLFWFHPLVWLLGARLMEERERTCDEAVLDLGRQPGAYATAILKVCEFFLEPPPKCVSGVTGADLKRRVAGILSERPGDALPWMKKVLLGAAAALAIGVPVVLGGQTQRTVATDDWMRAAGGKMAFDVAKIRLNALGIPPQGPRPASNVDLDPGDIYMPTGGILRLQNKSLRTLIAFAYKMNGDQQLYLHDHAPSFVLNDRFDLEARTENQAVTKDQMRLMMQALLAERFKLAVHRETQVATVLGLTPLKAGKLGPQIRPHQANDPVCANHIGMDPKLFVRATDGFPPLCGTILGMPPTPTPDHKALKIAGRDIPMRLIAEALVAPYTGDTGLAHPVIDTTGMTGTFDFTLELEYTEMDPTNTPMTSAGFLEELNDQLGMKLNSQKGPEDVYVVDRVERLSAQD
jgi:bla regulator protein blaR1